MKKWDVDKFEQLRQIWDETRVPIVLAGTHKLDEIPARWNGKDEVTQLSSRMSPFEYRGINEKEVRAILREYDCRRRAGRTVKVALDKNNGGYAQPGGVLGLCLEAAGDDRIDRAWCSRPSGTSCDLGGRMDRNELLEKLLK